MIVSSSLGVELLILIFLCVQPARSLAFQTASSGGSRGGRTGLKGNAASMSSPSKISLVTGANRGIGLELAKQLKERGEKVIAVCRSSSEGLEALKPGVEVVEGVDISKAEGIVSLSEALKATGSEVGLLVNNAGIHRKDTLETLDYKEMETQFKVNALGPLRVTEAVLPFMKDGGKVIMITSRMSSIADASMNQFGYRMSKISLNIASVALANTLKSQNRQIAVGILHPGLVLTDMIAKYNPVNSISPTTSVNGMMERIDGLTMDNSGSFWHAVTGEILPW